jgi:RNA polymerase sigma-70 factor (ECF subfamily)
MDSTAVARGVPADESSPQRAAGHDGVPSDLERVFREHFSYVSHSLLRLGVPDRDVDDLTHDVFLTVHKKLRELDPNRPIRPWLFGVAFRHASEYRRRAPRRRELLMEEPPDVEDEARAPDSEAGGRQMRQRSLRALAALDPDKRAVLVMHDVDGHTAPEIAEALRIPMNTVYSRLRAARERFRQAVEAEAKEVKAR